MPKKQTKETKVNAKCSYSKMVPISELKPHPKNRNTHPPDQIARLARIIEYQGFRHPIIVSHLSGFIVAGHGRLEAAKKLGLAEVPVDFQEFESREAEYAFLVADNAIALWAELDLDGINTDVVDLGDDFDLDLLGLKDFELSTDGNVGNGDPDDVPEVPKEAKTKRGELWTLGNHRLLIDDCTVKENVERLMAGEKADMVFTDPPYNMASENDLVAASVSGAMARLKASDWDKNFDPRAALERLYEILADDVTVYICTSHHLAGQIWDWMASWPKGSSYNGYCLWAKPNPMPSLMKRHWTWAAELICYATRGRHTFNFPKDGHALNVWTFTKHSDGSHPTQKPVEVVEHAVTHSSKPGHRVADTFLGSGSTLIACEKTGRRCFGMEIEPLYGDVILDRWSKYTGKDPVREDGMKWSTLKCG